MIIFVFSLFIGFIICYITNKTNNARDNNFKKLQSCYNETNMYIKDQANLFLEMLVIKKQPDIENFLDLFNIVSIDYNNFNRSGIEYKFCNESCYKFLISCLFKDNNFNSDYNKVARYYIAVITGKKKEN